MLVVQKWIVYDAVSERKESAVRGKARRLTVLSQTAYDVWRVHPIPPHLFNLINKLKYHQKDANKTKHVEFKGKAIIRYKDKKASPPLHSLHHSPISPLL